MTSRNTAGRHWPRTSSTMMMMAPPMRKAPGPRAVANTSQAVTQPGWAIP
ncbi:Uncharacterised protein [Mycobacteroides abscessus subsp. abscessus]|nr:Uncharacterised protein [Mycobacteroides abscessus subsp. abscessus]